jgi:hypothetical protein
VPHGIAVAESHLEVMREDGVQDSIADSFAAFRASP